MAGGDPGRAEATGPAAGGGGPAVPGGAANAGPAASGTDAGRAVPARRWRLRREGTAGGRPRVRRTVRSPRSRLREAAPYLVVLTVVAFVASSGWVVYGTGVLGVRTVRVEGARQVPRAEVLRAVAVRPGTPLARVDVGAVAGRVGRLPAVADVRVERSWPGALVVRVTERVAVLAVAARPGYRLVDREGVPFRHTPTRPAGLPLAELARPGPGDRPTRAVLTVVAALTPPLRSRVDRVRAPTDAQVELRLSDGRAVFWGDAEDSARKAVAAAAVLSRPGRRIDVSAPGLVTIR